MTVTAVNDVLVFRDSSALRNNEDRTTFYGVVKATMKAQLCQVGFTRVKIQPKPGSGEEYGLGCERTMAMPPTATTRDGGPEASDGGVETSGEIHGAAEHGDLEKVKALLRENPDLVFGKTTNGATPLHSAAANGHKDVVEFLLANKADIDAVTNDGSTALHFAAANGHKDVVDFLLANKADIDAKDNHGKTPMQIAEIYGHNEVAELLHPKQLALLSSVTHLDEHFAIVQGQVQNISKSSMRRVIAVVSWYTADGSFITSDDAEVDYNPILPGQVSPYKVFSTANPQMEKYIVEFKFDGAKIAAEDRR